MKRLLAILVMIKIFGLSCSGEDGGGTPTPTPTPNPDGPQIESTFPDDGATEVGRNVPISVTFDRAMNSSTLTTSTFYADAGSGAVPALVTYSATDKTATLAPSSNFAAGASVTVHLKETVADSDGNAIGVEVTWTFTCSSFVDTTAPTFAGIVTATNNSDGTATLTWAAATDDNTPASAITYVAYKDGIFTTSIKSQKGGTSMVTPSYAPGTYSFSVRARDASGNIETNTASDSVGITVPSSSWSGDVYPLFSSTCTDSECHDSSSPEADMNLIGQGTAYSNLVNVDAETSSRKRVDPGDPNNSELYKRLESGSMPKDKTDFSSSELDTVRFWILNGALNN